MQELRLDDMNISPYDYGECARPYGRQPTYPTPAEHNIQSDEDTVSSITTSICIDPKYSMCENSDSICNYIPLYNEEVHNSRRYLTPSKATSVPINSSTPAFVGEERTFLRERYDGKERSIRVSSCFTSGAREGHV